MQSHFSIATGVGILYAFDKVDPQALIFVVQLGHWITAFFSTTFATNVICTAVRLPHHYSFVPVLTICKALVAYRVWTINLK